MYLYCVLNKSFYTNIRVHIQRTKIHNVVSFSPFRGLTWSSIPCKCHTPSLKRFHNTYQYHYQLFTRTIILYACVVPLVLMYFCSLVDDFERNQIRT